MRGATTDHNHRIAWEWPWWICRYICLVIWQVVIVGDSGLMLYMKHQSRAVNGSCHACGCVRWGWGDLLPSVFINSSYIKNFVPFWVEVNKCSKIFFCVYYKSAKFFVLFLAKEYVPGVTWNCFFLVFFKPTRWLAVFLKLSWLALFKECIWILASYYIYVLVLLSKSCLELCHLSCVCLCTFTLLLFLCHPLNSDTCTPPTQQQRNTPRFTWVYLKRKEIDELYSQSLWQRM